MNQKEARAKGLQFSSGTAQKVLKRIREHVLWSDELTIEEWRQFDQALLLLEPLAYKYEAEWLERCRLSAERWRRRREEHEAAPQ